MAKFEKSAPTATRRPDKVFSFPETAIRDFSDATKFRKCGGIVGKTCRSTRFYRRPPGIPPRFLDLTGVRKTRRFSNGKLGQVFARTVPVVGRYSRFLGGGMVCVVWGCVWCGWGDRSVMTRREKSIKTHNHTVTHTHKSHTHTHTQTYCSTPKPRAITLSHLSVILINVSRQFSVSFG